MPISELLNGTNMSVQPVQSCAALFKLSSNLAFVLCSRICRTHGMGRPSARPAGTNRGAGARQMINQGKRQVLTTLLKAP